MTSIRLDQHTQAPHHKDLQKATAATADGEVDCDEVRQLIELEALTAVKQTFDRVANESF